MDTRTEVLIQKAMARLMEGRTSFVIAHRLSTIRDAKLILVMNQGKIIETGTHRELLAKGGFYAELYNSQFTGANIETEEAAGTKSALARMRSAAEPRGGLSHQREPDPGPQSLVDDVPELDVEKAQGLQQPRVGEGSRIHRVEPDVTGELEDGVLGLRVIPPPAGITSAVFFTFPLLMFWAKTVLNAFTTCAPGSFFWRFSAPLVVNPTASPPSLVSTLVASTTGLPFAAAPISRHHRVQRAEWHGENHHVGPRRGVLHPAALSNHLRFVAGPLDAGLERLAHVPFSNDPDFLLHEGKVAKNRRKAKRRVP